METRWRPFLAALAMLAVTAGLVGAQETSSSSHAVRESLDNAWWTGPMLAASAATLPRGHFLVEPYLYDVTVQGLYDGDGQRHSVARSHGVGSLTYILYGLADGLTVGVIPTAGFNVVSGGPDSSGVGPGDVTLHAQGRLTRFREGHRIPATSIVVEETLPTGKYDRLGGRPSDGLGSGAYKTSLGFFSQTYFWLPNGRILRARVDVVETFAGDAHVEGVSVYGTPAGFRGTAKPGRAFLIDTAAEYSWSRRVVLALDVLFRHDASTRVGGISGTDPQNPIAIAFASAPSDGIGFAPAVEFSWGPNIGVLFGTRVVAAGRNATATVTPAVAVNLFW